MAVTITHSTPADGTFSATGAAAWDASHSVSGLGTMAEQNSNNVNITGGSITGVTGVLTGLTVNSTTTSGGAAGQIMFDTGSVLQESSNLVWDNTNKKLTITGATVTTSQPVLDMTQTWNAAGVTFTGLKFNVTDTASNSSSLLMDLQVGGASRVSFKKDGRLTITAPSATNSSIVLSSPGLTNTPQYSINATYQGTAANFIIYDAINDVTPFNIRANGTSPSITATSTTSFAWNNSVRYNETAPDLFLTRRGAANLRLGLADAAAPVAQTLSVQSVVAGTSNTAGANLTITGSQGTGTGAGGSIIFQTAPAGSSGTAQNALSTALTINSLTQSLFSDGSVSGPSISFSSASNTGIYYFSSGFHFAAGGANIFGVRTEVRVNGSYAFGFTSGTTTATVNDVLLTRRGAANLRFGAADAAAPVAQTLSVQSVVAGTSNTAGANLTITGSQGTGTGAGGSIIFQVAPAGSSGTAQNALSTAFQISGAGFTSIGVGSPATDGLSRLSIQNTDGLTTASNVFTFSGAAATDRSIYVLSRARGTSASPTLVQNNDWVGTFQANAYNGSAYNSVGEVAFQIDGTFTSGQRPPGRIVFSTAVVNGAVTERLRITTAGLVTFGGATSSFPALKPSSTILQVRLADDSAYAPVEASTVRTATAYTVATLPVAGTAGRRAYVTDATAPTWLGALTGGGTVVCPVFDNGTAWVAG